METFYPPPDEFARNQLIREIYTEYHDILYLAARRRLLQYGYDPGSANDILQDFYIKLLRKFDLVAPQYRALGLKYLRTVLYNVVKDYARAQKRRLELHESLREEETNHSDETFPGEEESQGWLFEKSAPFLKEIDQKILDLHLKDFGNKDVAEILDLPVGYVNVRMHRIKKTLIKNILSIIKK